MLAGCGAQSSRRGPVDLSLGVKASNTPAAALRGFYAALIGGRAPVTACRFVAHDFYLRPSGIVGINVPAAGTGRRALPPSGAGADLRPIHGPCPALLERLLREGREDRYPFRYWMIQSIVVHSETGFADTVTTDGSSAMRLVGKRWVMQWVFS